MDLSTSAVVFLFLTYHLCEAEHRSYNSVLMVSNGGEWGEWGKIEFCPKGHAYGFSLKVQEMQGLTDDDTSLNGIRLHCSTGAVVQSTVGPLGKWTKIKECPKGYLVAFVLNVEAPQGPSDDTAANNIRFNCGDGTGLEAKSTDFGTYGRWSKRCPTGAICGIQTKVEAYSESFTDNTALNDVRFFCCD
ncbi:vitelline membrane outer layer protein 1-like [Podarcis raffonei]|uniref:vitelline membrane outer layer protein 1-like n=1 Tax=Podarcis raffonei TaxID=65483 RepID=UPI0023293AFC|nr:vitelline membrane outer layer protein 1-like [Podarcis raffonei]